MKVKKSDIYVLLKATFPEFKGRRFFVHPKQKVLFYNLNWSEGAKNYYRACRLDGSKIETQANLEQAPWMNQFEGKECSVPEGIAIACHSFHGQYESISFFINPLDFANLLP